MHCKHAIAIGEYVNTLPDAKLRDTFARYARHGIAAAGHSLKSNHRVPTVNLGLVPGISTEDGCRVFFLAWHLSYNIPGYVHLKPRGDIFYSRQEGSLCCSFQDPTDLSR